MFEGSFFISFLSLIIHFGLVYKLTTTIEKEYPEKYKEMGEPKMLELFPSKSSTKAIKDLVSKRAYMDIGDDKIIKMGNAMIYSRYAFMGFFLVDFVTFFISI